MRMALVLGTRPQLVKSAPIIREAVRRNYDLEVVHTGQHYDLEMSDVFFEIFSIPPPTTNLNVGSGSDGYQTGEIIIRLEKFLSNNPPSLVIVPGDTNSALGAALAAVKLRIPTTHLEAGARSSNMKMQEEVNRRAIDHISSGLFAVSPTCLRNLSEEKVPGRATLSGDTMFEIFEKSKKRIEESGILDEIDVAPRDYFVATLHRAENTSDIRSLVSTIKSLNALGKKVVFPAHPRTQNVLKANGQGITGENLKVIKPVDYFSMIKLLKNSLGLFTDSGGLQKEAFWANTPCVTLRNETEWMETVDVGVNFMVGTNPGSLPKLANELVSNRGMLEKRFVTAGNPFAVPGRDPSQIVCDELMKYAEGA
jgi:UDP-GlcNAc3NAcA epimerase